MATTVFHGTDIASGCEIAVRGIDTRNLFWVTDTLARATRYANARATREVTDSFEMKSHAVVVEMTTEDEIDWIDRGNRDQATATSLDQVEFPITKQRLTVTKIHVKTCDKAECPCRALEAWTRGDIEEAKSQSEKWLRRTCQRLAFIRK